MSNRRIKMKRLMSIMLTVIMCIGMLTLPVRAESGLVMAATVDTNTKTIKVTGISKNAYDVTMLLLPKGKTPEDVANGSITFCNIGQTTVDGGRAFSYDLGYFEEMAYTLWVTAGNERLSKDIDTRLGATEDFYIKASVDRTTKQIVVSGVSKDATDITFYLLEVGKSPEDVANGITTPIGIGQTTVNNDRSFTCKMGYADDGTYTVWATAGGKSLKLDVSTTGASVNMKSGLGNIFNLPMQYNSLDYIGVHETDKMFKAAKAELPDEMPIYLPMEPSGTAVFVSAGATNGDGSKEKPYGSINDAIRALGTNVAHTVIYLREGTYDVSQLSKITNVKSNADFPLYITAYNNENVVFTDTTSIDVNKVKPISDVQLKSKLSVDAAEKVMCVDVSNITLGGTPLTTTISVNKKEYRVAQWPNVGHASMREYVLGEGQREGENGVIDSGTITVKAGSGCGDYRETGKYGTTGGIEFCLEQMRPFTWDMEDDIYICGSFYEEWSSDNLIVESFNTEYRSVRTTKGTQWGCKYKANNDFVFKNVFEEMDAPGEYYLDRDEKKLYFYPYEGETLESLSISFGNQTMLQLVDCSNIVIDGINFDTVGDNAIAIKGNLNVGTENILVQNCNFTNVGGTAVSVSGDTQFCGVINSRFNNCRYAVLLYWPTAQSKYKKDLVPQHNFVQNNYMYGSEVGIYGTGNVLSHNAITNTKGSAVYSSHDHENVIEYNEIANCMLETADAGAIYIAGSSLGSSGNHVRYNYIHDNRPGDITTTYGLYLDDLRSRAYVYGNVSDGSAVYMHGGSSNAIYNNVMMNFTDRPSIADSQNYLMNYFDVRWKYGTLQYGTWTEFLLESNTNVYLDVVSENSIYRKRYPSLYDWASKMYTRIDQYKEDSSIYSVADYEKWDKAQYINMPGYEGTESDGSVSLDRYLRSPRYNYYDQNVFLNCQTGHSNGSIRVCNDGQHSDIMGANANFDNTIFDNGITEAGYAEIRKVIPEFEDIPFNKMGPVTDVFAGVTVEAPTEGLPNMTEAYIPELVFEWEAMAGASFKRLEVATDKDFSNIVFAKDKEGEVIKTDYYAPTDDEKAKLTDGTTYYWRVTAYSSTKATVGGEQTSETYSFTATSTPTSSAGNYGFTDINVTDAGGNAVPSFGGQTALTATFNIYNSTGNVFKDYIVYAVCYDSNGRFIGYNTADGVEVGADSFSDDMSITVNGLSNTETMALFMWSADGNQTPLSRVRYLK